jgi:hypothetical protein
MANGEEYPHYLDALEIGEERSARARIRELEAEIHGLEKTFQDARRAKRILYVRGLELEHEVVRFMAEELRLPVRAPQGDGGGFWLGRGADQAWCMGEVIAIEGGNVNKEHLAQVMVHRAGAGKRTGLPALLVANTFHAGHTMEERDQPVRADEIRRATEDGIVVVRTLDLVRLWLRASNGFPAAEQLTEALESGGGWFEVDNALSARMHRRDDPMTHQVQGSGGPVAAAIPPPAATTTGHRLGQAPNRPDAARTAPGAS